MSNSSQVCNLLSQLKALVSNFRAGNVANCILQWQALTSDPEILQIVRGDVINFEGNPPANSIARNCNVSADTEARMNKEIRDMLEKGIIVPSSYEQGEYVSPIFPISKPDGSIRIILNLKKLNEYVQYLHFKMDNIKVVLANITKNCYMCSLDLKSAYHSVKIHENFQKYLKFEWNAVYQYTCYPNGLGPCPRKFTKLMKVPLSHLREHGHFIVGYIDDFFLKGNSTEQCFHSLLTSTALLQRLGFTIHPVKSQLEPKQVIVFLGFVINSHEMSVTLTDEKKHKLYDLIEKILSRPHAVIRHVASLIGIIVSSLPGTLHGALYYRRIEMDKNSALKRCKGNYEEKMTLSADSRSDLQWWLENIHTTYAPIHWPPITQEMCTDASGKNGWGASVQGMIPIGGAWTEAEDDIHINVKEMIAILYALRSLVDIFKNQHVRVLCDNTTAVQTINKMGTTKSKACNDMVKGIWEFCIKHNIFITCTHIPGKENIIADQESRKEYRQGEWMLHKRFFHDALRIFQFQPNIDCFATRINAQLPTYVSRYPDPYASQVDAFSFNWADYKPYIFPPFSVINRVLQKIRVDKTLALCVLPEWKTQAWWPQLQEMMVQEPLVLKPGPQVLVLPNKKGELHPLHRKLRLVICLLSGKNTDPEDIQMQP